MASPDATGAAEQPALSWQKKMLYAAAGYQLHAINTTIHHGRTLFSKIRSSENGPDRVLSYSCRPSLSVRVFYPETYDAAHPPTARLPILFTIHGGGFVIGNPEDTDAWNHSFARRGRVLVVALDYRKAPQWPFPHGIHDLEALVLAVLADESLPIDPDRVALLGWSAGGNLALAVSSLPSLRIHAVVPVYPVVDMSLLPADKARTRPYKPQLPGRRGAPTDYLLTIAPVLDWSYVPRDPTTETLRDPLLSPAYAPRETLPPYVFILGCELDMLAMEGFRLASRLAGRPPPPDDAVVGRPEPGVPGELVLEGDERFAFETRTDDSSYRYLLVPDVLHGFDMATKMEGDEGSKIRHCQEAIEEWLFAGPFAEKK